MHNTSSSVCAVVLTCCNCWLRALFTSSLNNTSKLVPLFLQWLFATHLTDSVTKSIIMVVKTVSASTCIFRLMAYHWISASEWCIYAIIPQKLVIMLWLPSRLVQQHSWPQWETASLLTRVLPFSEKAVSSLFRVPEMDYYGTARHRVLWINLLLSWDVSNGAFQSLFIVSECKCLEYNHTVLSLRASFNNWFTRCYVSECVQWYG